MQDASTGVSLCFWLLRGSYKIYVCARAAGYMYSWDAWFLLLTWDWLWKIVIWIFYAVETKKAILVHQGSPQQESNA